MKMQGNAPTPTAIGNLSILERSLAKKQAPMKTVKAMPRKVSGKK